MESWQRYLPDYQFVLWDKEKIKEIDCSWINSAIIAKKWAFAADYIRLYALYNYGGIYLDCDVEVIKPFDNLLERSYFVGRETHKNVIEAAVIGAEPSLNWLKDALDWYESKEFNVTQLNNPAIAIPVILKNILSKKSNVAILPAEFFSPKDNRTGNVKITQNTYTIHHFDGNWFNNYQREYFKIRVKYSQKYGALVGLFVATLFSLKKKMRILEI
jgi:mannosyltransferase OCH1-like enzyme